MSTLSIATIKSQNTLPPAVQNSSGTEIGTFCRAWVNFNGTGTVAIRASFNVSSITDNGTGDYTVNFTTALPDANYAYAGMGRNSANQEITTLHASTAPTTSALRIRVQSISAYGDGEYVNVIVFR